MIKRYYLLFLSLFVWGSFTITPKLQAEKHESHCHSHSNDKCESETKVFKHNIQLQLSDSNGFPVEGTEFWVTIDVIKNGQLVTLELPLINFQTGQVSMSDPYFPSGQVIPGF